MKIQNELDKFYRVGKISLQTIGATMAMLPLALVAQSNATEEEVIDLDPFEVNSQAQIQAISLELYRESNALKSVTSADEMGQFVDQNVAESLHRLSGISITRDQGEGRFVSIRGIESALNSTTVNGMRIGSPEASSRELPLDIIPIGVVKLIEVIKVPTPDMPGDSIGGAINISSESAFKLDERIISYSALGTYSDLTDDLGPKLSFGYTDLLSINGGENNFGISFGISYQDREFGSDNIETVYDYLDNQATNEEVFAPIESEIRMYEVNRERLGMSLNFDYSPSDGHEFFFNTIYSKFTDAETRQRSIVIFEDGDLESVSGNNYNFSDIDEDGFRRRVRFRTKDQEILAFSTGGRHMLDNWKINYAVGYSEAKEEAPDEIEGRFEKTGTPLSANVTAGNGIPTYGINDNGTADTGYYMNSNYEFDRLVTSSVFSEETNKNIKADFERLNKNGSSAPIVKFGFDARFTDKDADVNEAELRSVPSLNLDQLTGSVRSFPFDNLGDGISSTLLRQFIADNSDQILERPQDAEENTILSSLEDYSAEEDVYAAYLMGTWKGENWSLIAGGRFEETDFKATGNEIVLDANGDLSGVNTVSAESSYSNFLPGVHFRYNVQDDLVVRFAWSNTIGRPSFSDLAPNAEVNTEDAEVSMGNPDLDPYESSNLDLIVDYYLPGAGVFSAGVFYKDIDNYVADFTTNNDPDFPGFEVERPINGTKAEVLGFELNWEQQLGTYTEALDGFLIGANATFLDTDFELAQRPTEDFALPLASEEVYNFYIGYEKGRFSTRLSSNWRGKYLDEIGDSREYDIYVNSHNQWDLTFSYRFSTLFEFVAEVVNITDEPLELYQGNPGNNLQTEEYGVTYNFGFKGRF